MKQRIGIVAAALCMGLGGQVLACEDRQSPSAAADRSQVERALIELRVDQQQQVQLRARQALAQMRSQALTVLAQGASTAADLSINARP